LELDLHPELNFHGGGRRACVRAVDLATVWNVKKKERKEFEKVCSLGLRRGEKELESLFSLGVINRN